MRPSPPNINRIQIQHSKSKALPNVVWSKNVETNLAGIVPERRDTVISFLRYMKARGSGMCRIESCALAIRTLEVFSKNYMDFTKEDLEQWLVDYIEKVYAPSTVNLFKVTIKQFFKWLLSDEETREYPQIVRWMKIGKLKTDYGKRVLSKQDVLKMMEVTENPRDRAIVHVLYESGCRVSELLSMTIQDVSFDQYGSVIRVDGKTGERRVRLIESVPDLRLYLDMHPNRNNPESAVWVINRRPYEVMKRVSLESMIYKIAERAGLPDGISPHSFRHSRATCLASDLTEAQMKVLFGWVGESDMPARYVHLSGKDVDDALLRINGIKKIEAEDRAISPTAPKPCPRCKTNNSPAARFCMTCSSPLDTKTVLEIEQRNSKAEELTARVIESIIQKAPDLVAAVLKEQGLIGEIQQVAGKKESS